MKKDKAIELAKYKGLKPINILPNEIEKNKRFSFIDNNGYKFSLTYDQLRDKRSGHAIVKKQNPFSLENIQTYIYNNKSTAKVMSTKWCGGDSKLTVQCEKCGRHYEVRWYNLFQDKKFQCNKCAYSNPYNKKSINDTIKICRKHGYTLLEDTYIQRRKFDMVDKLGYKYSNCSVYTLDKRTNKSKRFDYHNKYQVENMRLYIRLNNMPLQLARESQTNVKKDDKIDFVCCECGKIYSTTWTTSMKKYRCDLCSKHKSNLEYMVESYLKSINVKYTTQKRFEWCKMKRSLPFDFYLGEYNTVIEVNGSQHYYESHWFNKDIVSQQKVDKFKQECCIRNNVNYVAIPFWLITQSKTETYKTIINNIIN